MYGHGKSHATAFFNTLESCCLWSFDPLCDVSLWVSLFSSSTFSFTTLQKICGNCQLEAKHREQAHGWQSAHLLTSDSERETNLPSCACLKRSKGYKLDNNHSLVPRPHRLEAMARASPATILQRLRIPVSLWAPRSAGLSSSSQALPTPILRTHRLRPQKSKFTPTLREGEFAVLPAHEVPPSIRRPAYAAASDGRPQPPGVSSSEASHSFIDEDPEGWRIDARGEIQSPDDLKRMQRVCRVAATALKIALDASKPGVTTEDIDALVHHYLLSQGAYPAAINFFGFPKSLCASVNEGDCAATTMITPVSQEHQRLVAAAKECLNVAVRAVKPAVPIAHIGKVITEFAHSEGFSVVSEFCGHFIGRRLHLPPLVPHGHPNDAEHEFRVGQTFTIEPILCEGSGDVRCWEDGWTTVTQDCGRCAQFEHTLVVTEDGAVPLTCAEDE